MAEPKIKNGKIEESSYNLFWVFDYQLSIEDAFRKRSTVLKMSESTYDILNLGNNWSPETNNYKNHKVIIDNSLEHGEVIFCEDDAHPRALKEENNG